MGETKEHADIPFWSRLSKKRAFDIPKKLVRKTYKQIKKQKDTRVDRKKIRDFGATGSKRIDELWEELSSGKFTPSPVGIKYLRKKTTDGWRTVGVPAVRDHIVQTILRDQLSSAFKKHWHSHTFRRWGNKKGQKITVKTAAKRCRQYDWALVMDIEQYGHSIDHQLLMNMLRKHFKNPWVLHYTEMMIKAPVRSKDGALLSKPDKGLAMDKTLSVFLADFFLHDVFDQWMKQNHPNVPFERHIDDIVIHCKSEEQAKALLSQTTQRFLEYQLRRNEKKTKIVYCQDDRRKGAYSNTSFKLLQHTFRARKAKNSGSNVAVFSPKRNKKSLSPAINSSQGDGNERRWSLSLFMK